MCAITYQSHTSLHLRHLGVSGSQSATQIVAPLPRMLPPLATKVKVGYCKLVFGHLLLLKTRRPAADGVIDSQCTILYRVLSLCHMCFSHPVCVVPQYMLFPSTNEGLTGLPATLGNMPPGFEPPVEHTQGPLGLHVPPKVQSGGDNACACNSDSAASQSCILSKTQLASHMYNSIICFERPTGPIIIHACASSSLFSQWMSVRTGMFSPGYADVRHVDPNGLFPRSCNLM
jgi:hypothetical protein